MTIKKETAAALALVAALDYSKAWGTDETGGCITLTETWKEGGETVRTVVHHYGEDTAEEIAAREATYAKHAVYVLVEAKRHNEAGTNQSGVYKAPPTGDVTVAIEGVGGAGAVGDLG